LKHATASGMLPTRGEALRKRLQQTRFRSPYHEAMLNLMVAALHVRDQMEQACREHEITEPQYNVLRILRGAGPAGHPRREIARRMISRAPDLTRLIDRLASRGLVERKRGEADRRHSVTRITKKGLKLLEDLQPTIDALDEAFAARLAPRDARELSRICELLYGDPESEGR